MTQIFYATTATIFPDGWGFEVYDDEDGREQLKLKSGFSEKIELENARLDFPYDAIEGVRVPHDTVMIACWMEVEPGVIPNDNDISFFVGTLRDGPDGRMRILLPDGRALIVPEKETYRVHTVDPKDVGITVTATRWQDHSEVYR